jgi:hypothetical protein
MSTDLELWTQKGDEVAQHLPRAAEWESFGDEFQFIGGPWLVSVFAPEPVEPYQAPPELQNLVDGLHFHIELAVEPSDPDDAAWAFVGEVMESLGRALGGAALDPKTGEPRSWAA